jgi:hypothetical protein
VHIEKEAARRDDEWWDNARPYALSTKEQNIYNMVDSIKHVPLYNNIYNVVNTVVSGYLETKYFAFGPYSRIYSFNKIEGNRVQIGGRTTPGVSRKFRLSGFLAYGFKDKQKIVFLNCHLLMKRLKLGYGLMKLLIIMMNYCKAFIAHMNIVVMICMCVNSLSVPNYTIDTANADGKYKFTSFAPGNYIVRFIYGSGESTVLGTTYTNYNNGNEEENPVTNLYASQEGYNKKTEGSGYSASSANIGLNKNSYNGQDYKSTSYQVGVNNGSGAYTNNKTGSYEYTLAKQTKDNIQMPKI